MTWRNLAYLAAVTHGARLLLDADCSAPLAEAARVLQGRPLRDTGLLYNQTLLFNPYAHFGAWSAAPRAVGEGSGGRDRGWGSLAGNSRLYFVRDFDNVLVRHALSDRSDDVVFSGQGPAPGPDGGGGLRSVFVCLFHCLTSS